MAVLPYIPEFITVHLGPPDSGAQNVTVTFSDYIKNVASSEIYPTWNESAIVANIRAQVSFALNRVYLEYYKSRGYSFQITNSTAIDQSFTPGREIFDNIDRLVNDLFDDYIRRRGLIEPLAAKYCNGTTSTCEGLSQWGSQALAEEGRNSIEILKYYFGEDIEIVVDAPIEGLRYSYPGSPLRRSSSGPDVQVIQVSLNRVSQNYPMIPKINPVNSVFDENTENAVKVFQQIFNLTSDGIVGSATWYQLVKTYVGIKQLGELESEGFSLFGRSLEYPDAISMGDRGEKVVILQYFLSLLSQFYFNLPFVRITGVFGDETKEAVIAFQKYDGLPETGVVDDTTWNAIYEAYRGIVDTLFEPNRQNAITAMPYPGVPLSQEENSSGDAVRTLQQYLNMISVLEPSITPVPVTGTFDDQTTRAVEQYQTAFQLPVNGIVDRTVWNEIMKSYKNVVSAGTLLPEQYPGFELKPGDRDPAAAVSPSTDSPEADPAAPGGYEARRIAGDPRIPIQGQPIRDLQQYLRTISNRDQGAPDVVPDGIYGEQTRAAVAAFQETFDLAVTGVTDYITWTNILDVYHFPDQARPNDICPAIYPLPAQVIRRGDRSVHLFAMQGMMKALGSQFSNLDEVDATGVHDARSVAFVKRVQIHSGLSPTGDIDCATWNAIAALYEVFISRKVVDR